MTKQELLREANSMRQKMIDRRGQFPNEEIFSFLKARSWVDGNYTVVLLEANTEPDSFIGIAKRKPTDKPNDSIGVQLALHRAIEKSFGIV